MPSFKIEELRKSVLGSASNTLSLTENRHEVGQKAVGQVRQDRRRSQGESERLIKEFVYGQSKAVLFLDICDALDRRESAILRNIVTDMVNRGVLVKTEHPSIAGNIPTFKYGRPGLK